jgi:hypothetical protein
MKWTACAKSSKVCNATVSDRQRFLAPLTCAYTVWPVYACKAQVSK